ncbi:MAG: hypothetical protein EOM23_07925, partial [Candidatus Moranbacteria bacterium]|nr:hypothetical protein [Candidatus Moranbacteria bacterium]
MFVIWSASISLTLFALDALTNGWYTRSVFGLMTSMTAWSLSLGLELTRVFMFEYGFLMIAALMFLWWLVRGRAFASDWRFLFLGLWLSLLYLWITLCREGSDRNYFLEPFLWLLFILARAVPSLKQAWQKVLMLCCLSLFTVN